MHTMETDRLVDDYLRRLEDAAAHMQRARRAELVAEIRGHIETALREEQAAGEAAVRNVLDRLGPPEEIVEAAEPPSPHGDQRAGKLEIVALIALIVPFIGWLIGAVLVFASRVWSRRDKLIGALLLLLPIVVLSPGLRRRRPERERGLHAARRHPPRRGEGRRPDRDPDPWSLCSSSPACRARCTWDGSCAGTRPRAQPNPERRSTALAVVAALRSVRRIDTALPGTRPGVLAAVGRRGLRRLRDGPLRRWAGRQRLGGLEDLFVKRRLRRRRRPRPRRAHLWAAGPLGPTGLAARTESPRAGGARRRSSLRRRLRDLLHLGPNPDRTRRDPAGPSRAGASTCRAGRTSAGDRRRITRAAQRRRLRDPGHLRRLSPGQLPLDLRRLTRQKKS